MRHGFFITCLTANQARPIIDVALMADICGRSLLLDTVCNEDKSDYSKCVGCQASRGEAGKVWTMPSVHRKWPQIWHRIIKHRWGVWKGCSEIAPPPPGTYLTDPNARFFVRGQMRFSNWAQPECSPWLQHLRKWQGDFVSASKWGETGECEGC